MEVEGMRRHQDWPLRLSQFLEDRRAQAFAWGSADCMIFCADAILEITGFDQAYDVRGTYSTQAGADAVVARFGLTVEDVLDERLGARKSVKYATRGDVVTYDYNATICAGIVDDTGRRAAFMTEAGITRIPLKLCREAWTV